MNKITIMPAIESTLLPLTNIFSTSSILPKTIKGQSEPAHLTFVVSFVFLVIDVTQLALTKCVVHFQP